MEKIKIPFYTRFVYPIYQFKYGYSYGFKIINILKQLNKSERFSREQLLEYQTGKLKRLVNHAYNHVPYYREEMDKIGLHPEDIKSAEDIKYFPIISKKQIKENFDKFISSDIHHRSVTRASTGGTTGEPLRFYRDMNTRIWTEAALLRGMSWSKYKIGDTGIDFRSDGWPSLLGKIRGRMVHCHYFPALAKDEEIISYLKRIKLVKPFYLTGYTSNLYRITNIFKKYDIKDIEIPVIFSTAEMLYDYQREIMEKQFDSSVYDYYGCNEIGSIAYECEFKTKHISDEHIILEVTDSLGNPLYDAPGEITITDLDNYAMPFIRYNNGDVGTISNDQCDCGRGLNVLKNVEGRSQDFLKTLDGNYVPAIFFPARFRALLGIDQYQIIQTDIHNITLRVVKNQIFSQNELVEMIRVIKEVIGSTTNITIEECNNILLTGRGKTRLVISKLPVEF